MLSAFLSQPFFSVFAFMLGSAVASFLCLAAERLPHQLAWCPAPRSDLTIWSPPSFCNSCQTPIQARYLVPVLGWLASGGKCATCRAPIPIFYPLCELFLGLACACLAGFFGPTWAGFSSIFLLLVLSFLALIDWQEAWLPEFVTLPLTWVGVTHGPFEPHARLVGLLAGLTLMYLSMLIVSLRRRNVFSGGDIMLAAAAGGWLGWPHILHAMLLGSAIFVGQAYLHRREALPAGPALAGGFFMVYLFKLSALPS